jgi:nitroreductase
MSEFQLDKEVSEKRSNDFAIQPLFLNRWSPRSFLGKSVPEEELVAVLEAAHWAPSCMNEQPWRFIVAKSKQALTKMQACLVPGNQIWANRAPVLLAIISRPTYIKTNQPNGWHSFDAGRSVGELGVGGQSAWHDCPCNGWF